MRRSGEAAVSAILGILCLAASACTVRFGGSRQDAGIPPGCGNGVLEIGEVCDGTDFAGQTCQSAIGHEAGELACTAACQLDLTGCYTCGDGEVDGPEGCDDANNNGGDGCSSGCQIENYHASDGEPSVCVCAVFVDIDPVPGPRNGTSWNNAFDEVQDGIDTAWNMAPGCEVWVAEGQYHIYQFSTTDRLELRNNVETYGGFTGVETARNQRDWVAHETILDGSRAINPGQRVRTVVRASAANAVLDGFTITNGNNTAGTGGGLRGENGPLTVANCVFINNEAEDGGGAMFRNDQFMVINCIIRGTEPNQIFNASGGWATVSYTNISGGYAGTNNFDADPLFVDAAGLDFHLLTGSPCIDVANGDQAPTQDADGNPRADDPNSPNNGAGTPNYADLGAFEYQP